MRIIAAAAVTVGLLAALLTTSGKTFAEANDDNASCMGLGSSFYAHFAPQQRAHVAHLVKEFFAEAPGERYRMFAQEKEGGSIPSPCGTAIE
ncbi:MAG TPA: hypothetical protein VGR43_01790 [Dehalococcoidia bacterium]|nr:hypothetical protein [Dehalococcoidia bacterium]